jgi:hypothetical protein
MANKPHTAGLAPLLPPLTAQIPVGPIALASSLLSRGATSSCHRALQKKAETSFWKKVVPEALAQSKAEFCHDKVAIQGKPVPHSQLRRKLLEHQTHETTTAREKRTTHAGEAAQALLQQTPATMWPLSEAAWCKLVRATYGLPDVETVTEHTCSACNKTAGPEHATTCTHPAVAAARTRRHNDLERFFCAVLRECPSVIVRTQPHVHKTGKHIPDNVARRADLAVTLLTHPRRSMLVDLKVINEYANEYESCGPDRAPAKKQAAAATEYINRTGRKDVRVWVITPGGRLSPHASADLALLAKELAISKDTLVAGAYAAVLNAHSYVFEAYNAALNRTAPCA